MSRVYRALEKAEKEKHQKVKEEPLSAIFEEEIISREQLPTQKFLEVDVEEVGGPSREDFPFLIAQPNSFAAEQFRKLKTHIFLHAPHPPHSILITSAVPQEGKTTVAMNLAVAISQEIHKTAILIDADLRMPSIYLKNFENSKGLANYLVDQVPLEEILINSGKENLRIIPAGKPSSKAAELIGSGKMAELMTSLREFGEDTYLIIDSPPVLSTSEPILLSKMVDGVILVIMAECTPRGAIRKGINSFDKQKILGVVFNQKELKPSKHYSEYYYRYYKNK
ncbi:MAG: CpsD/CapB family tyrosine-protein kinase [Deltaproteobacteria bacterium]|nr:CpsD/CapB family tyrosine-protein kinase [Deltaproteobacteria bacterium]